MQVNMIENRERVTEICQIIPGYFATDQRDHGKCSVSIRNLIIMCFSVVRHNDRKTRSNSNPLVTLQNVKLYRITWEQKIKFIYEQIRLKMLVLDTGQIDVTERLSEKLSFKIFI